MPDNLRRLRRLAGGISQEALAELADVHLNTIKDWERGISQGTPKTREKVSKALGVEPHVLLSPPSGRHTGDFTDLSFASSVLKSLADTTPERRGLLLATLFSDKRYLTDGVSPHVLQLFQELIETV